MYDERNPCDISYDILLIDASKIGDISYDSFFYKEMGRDDLDLSLKDLYAYLERRI